jgi:release factor glutamine methyltransferase
MCLATKKTYFEDLTFNVSEAVYEPAEDSFLLAENLDVNNNEKVLDMGTGCGILGVISANKASVVVAVDVNPHAIRCAKQNSAVNGVLDKMLFLQSDLFASIDGQTKFDLILFNSPYLPSENCETDFWIGRAWA